MSFLNQIGAWARRSPAPPSSPASPAPPTPAPPEAAPPQLAFGSASDDTLDAATYDAMQRAARAAASASPGPDPTCADTVLDPSTLPEAAAPPRASESEQGDAGRASAAPCEVPMWIS